MMNPRFAYKVFMAMNTAALIVGPVMLGLFLGFWMDKLFATSPFITFIGGLLGFTASIMSFLRLLKSIN